MLKPTWSKATEGKVRTNFKWLLPVLALAFLALSPKATWANEIEVAGSNSGTFSGSGTSTLLGLTYKGSTFDVTTSGGFAAIGSAPGTPNVNNLGSFTLNTTTANYTGNFTLNVTFTIPSGISGGSSTSFTATLLGSVSNGPSGGALITFSNPSQNFTFSNSSGTGSFTFNVNNVSVTPGQTVSLTGTITNGQDTPVPEPATLLLTGIGLGGLALKRRVLGA